MAKKARKEKAHFNSLKRNGFPDMSQIFSGTRLTERAVDLFYRGRNVLDPNVVKVIVAHIGLCDKCRERLGGKVEEETRMKPYHGQGLPL